MCNRKQLLKTSVWNRIHKLYDREIFYRLESPMKNDIYAVHCWIKGGGALNVVEALIRKKIHSWQSVLAIFTLYSDRKFLDVSIVDQTSLHIPIITALPWCINRFFARVDIKKPRGLTYFFDYRNLMPFFPYLMRVLSAKLKKKLKQHSGNVLISSYAVAKNIDVPEWIYKEIYFHQPMHYIWPLYEEYVGYMKGRKKLLYKKITPKLRRWDSKLRHYDTIYANSENTKQQIQDIYFPDQKTNIEVIHPPIEKRFFHERIVMVPDDYFFYINRLTKMFKHLDKIINLCNIYKIPLIIAWDGPDKHELMKIAWPTITFVGWVSDINTKINLMKKSKWVLSIAHESFGIVTAEALLLGVPVLGYQWGATPELVDETSGILSPSIDEEVLSQSFQKFISKEFDRQEIQNRARLVLEPWQQFWTE